MTTIVTKYLLIDTAPDGTPDSLADVPRRQTAQLEGIIDSFKREVDAIKVDSSLSQAGQGAALRRAQQYAQAALADARAKPVPGLGKTLDRWNAETKQYVADSIEAKRALPEVPALREHEIRAALMELAPLDRFATAMQAAEADDRETLFAIKNAPAVRPVLDDRQRAEVDRIHAATVDDPVFVNGATMRVALAARIEMNFDQAARTLRGEGRLALPLIPPAPAEPEPALAGPRVVLPTGTWPAPS